MLIASPLALIRAVGPNTNVDESDVVVVKRSLKRLGYYRPPVSLLSEEPDQMLFDAIKSFQSDRGLGIDGIMNPDGDTATELGRILSRPELNNNITQISSRNDNVPSEAACDHLYWNVDIPTCRAIQARRGNQAAARCYHTATFRYAACLRGTPINQLPPLDTLNQ